MTDDLEKPKPKQKKVTIEEALEMESSSSSTKNRCPTSLALNKPEAKSLLSETLIESSPPLATSSSTSTTPSSSPKKTAAKKPIEGERSASGAVADFFCASKMKPKSIRLPNISLQRGPVIAIFFTLVISSIILWYIFSGDGTDHEEHDMDVPRKGNRYVSPSRKPLQNASIDVEQNQNQTPSHQHTIHGQSELLFVLSTTLLIVLAIIAFVFVGALIHYYKKPNPFAPSSASSSSSNGRRHHRSLSIVSSIFTYHSHHNFLYYLEKHDDGDEKKNTGLVNNAKASEALESNNTQVRVECESKRRSKKSSFKAPKPPDGQAGLKATPATPTSASMPTTPPIIVLHPVS